MLPTLRTQKQNIRPEDCWREFTLAENKKAFFKIGPLVLWITRYQNEWRIGWKSSRNPLDTSFESEVPFKGEIPNSGLKIERFGFQETTPLFSLSPALADRSIVVKPEIPFTIHSKQQVTLYISTPLWVRACAFKDKKVISCIPITIPSDTWFGPTTMEGELCYGITTAARLQLDKIPIRYHRAITAVVIKNGGENALKLDSFNLPVPYLSLFKAKNNLYFTEAVTLQRGHNGDHAKLKLEREPLIEAGDTVKVKGPQMVDKANLLTRAVNSIFG